MSNLTTVTLTTGVPTAGSGTVSTLDNLIAAAGTASPQVQTVQGITSMTPLKVDGSGVTQPVSLSTLPVTNAGTFAVQATLAAETTKAIGVTRSADGSGNLITSTSGALDINIKSGANPNGSAVSASSAPVVIASDQSALTFKANTAGGATNLHFFSVTGAPAAVAIKASAGTLYGVQAVNTGAAPVYLKIYNTASGSVVVGTTVPLVTIPVPTTATTGAGIAISFPVGIVFGTAISYTFTNVAADNDATAVAVGTTLNVQFA